MSRSGRGHTITDRKQIKPLFEAYAVQYTAEVWNIQVSDLVVNPTMSRQLRRGHGKMSSVAVHGIRCEHPMRPLYRTRPTA